MNWKDLLREKALLVSDGAWGTELQKLGLGAGGAPELLNADRPEAVAQVARSYVEAGADIILTNTFGGSRWKLEKTGLGERTAELSRLGAELSVREAAGRALVFASVGPTGEFMAPLGTRAEAEFVECFAEQVAACAEGGADAILLESLSDLGEAKAGLKGAREACDLPVVVSLTFEHGAKGYATMMGVTPARAAEELEAAGADVVGANCGAGMENMIGVAGELRPATCLPLWIKPNAGLPRIVHGKTVFEETPEQMAGRVRELVQAGAGIIGGCCGSTPDHIRAIAAAVDKCRELAREVGADVLAAL